MTDVVVRDPVLAGTGEDLHTDNSSCRNVVMQRPYQHKPGGFEIAPIALMDMERLRQSRIALLVGGVRYATMSV